MSKTTVIVIILLSIVVFGDFAKLQIDENGVAMQNSIFKCISSITRTNFREGSILGLAFANFQNVTSNRLFINTNNIIMAGLMKESRWSIAIKNGRYFKGDKEVSSSRIPF